MADVVTDRPRRTDPAATGPGGASGRRGRSLLTSGRAAQVLTLVVFLLGWEIYADVRGGLLLPTFSETAVAFVDLMGEPRFWRAMYVSNQALVIGFLVAVGVGVPVGIVLGRFRTLERLSDVWLNILLVTPMAAIIPLLIMSVGFGLLSRVILVTVFSIVMVIVNVRVGVRQVDPALIEMARSFGARERQVWRRVLLPAALPSIMTGIRLGLGRAVTGMVIVELLMVSVGVGGLILEFRGLFKAPQLYATIVAILVEALVLIAVARWAERKATPWVPANRDRRRTP